MGRKKRGRKDGARAAAGSAESPRGRALLAYIESLDPGLVRLSELFFCFSDPTRLRMLLALVEGELTVSGLARVSGVTDSAASHQLRLLRARNLVTSRREGRRVLVSLSAPAAEALLSVGIDQLRGEAGD